MEMCLIQVSPQVNDMFVICSFYIFYVVINLYLHDVLMLNVFDEFLDFTLTFNYNPQ